MNTESIGQLFRTARKANSMTQQALADKLMVSPQAVSKWERGECMPDMALLQDVSHILGISVTQILNAGSEQAEPDAKEMILTLTKSIDASLFTKIKKEFEAVHCAKDLEVPTEAFMFLNPEQKSQLIDLLLQMKDYEILLDDLLQYTNSALREKIIYSILAKGHYENLEQLLPFATKSVKAHIVQTLLENGAYPYLEDMLPFLNKAHKDIIITYVLEVEKNPELLENFMPFFDPGQQRTVHLE